MYENTTANMVTDVMINNPPDHLPTRSLQILKDDIRLILQR